jgi:lipid II:glycine glycyltransferase (peptidoglycan interpeptide bridge formation enzyme)
MELRPLDRNFVICSDGLKPASKYYFHRLSLHSDLEQLFDGFHKDSIQRRIRRADGAGLVEACGRSTDLLDEFYSLFVITRGRHHLPATPRDWFRNLVQCQGDALDIRVAYKNQVPIAAILTMRFKDTLYYKYGCSDARFNQFGAMPWLIWRAIAAAKARGATEFDMGRTELDNTGLLNFKNHWVDQPEYLVYLKFPGASLADSAENWKMALAKKLFSHMPNRLLTITGRLIYRHIG